MSAGPQHVHSADASPQFRRNRFNRLSIEIQHLDDGPVGGR